jgi:cytochrome c biogenesis protein CcmG/thiol:disulfide interchange protein DsbE
MGLLSAGPVLAKTAPAPTHAPSFTLPTANGTVCLDSLRGRAVLVDFWASWCGPCKQSFPWMNSMHQTYGPKGLTIVAINVDKDRKLADAFLNQHPAPFTVAFDPSGKTAKAFKVWGMPSTYLVGPDGVILMSRAGFDPKKTGDVEHLIQEACTR